MTQVTVKSIEKAVEKIDKLDDDGLERLSETYVLKQEKLVGYIMSAAIEYDNDMLLDLLIYYFNIFSEALTIQGIEIEKITEDSIDAFQEEYVSMLDEYMETEEHELIDGFCNQPNMLSFLLSELEMEDETGQKLDDDTSTYLFIVGIAMIGLINKSIVK